MPLISVESLSPSVTELRLSVGRGNPLTPDALKELEHALHSLRDSPPRALVISSSDPNIFSGGFALPIIAHWDREALSGFFASFLRSIQMLLRFPAPTVCAVSGHAIAGGFILSLQGRNKVQAQLTSEKHLCRI